MKLIRKIIESDKENYLEMAKDFYLSDAVLNPIPGQYLLDTFNELMKSDNYVDAYIFEYNNNIAGYALLAKSFSQEAGGMVLWIDELYVKPKFRCRGIGHEFFKYLKENVHNVKRIRLEVEKNNKRAVSLYKKCGLIFLPYDQMMRDL